MYTKAAVDYHCVNNDVIDLLQISLFTHSYLEEPWQLFELKSIYVPYSLNPEADSETYTKLKLTKNYIALGAATYAPLDRSDLDKCFVLENKYLCTNSFLVQQSADHTYESAIYFNMSPKIVKESCTFETFMDFRPPPEVLEIETKVLLANVEIPWRFNCDQDKHVPQDLVGGRYAMMSKEHLCHCEVSMGDIVLPCSLQYCEGEIKPLSLMYTVNQAVLVFNPEFGLAKTCRVGCTGISAD